MAESVCLKRALNSEIQVLRDLNGEAEGKISKLEVLLTEKDENPKSVATKLEKTQKSLRLLNNGSSKLDHLITTGKLFNDYSGVGVKVSFLVLRLFLLNLICLMIPLMFL